MALETRARRANERLSEQCPERPRLGAYEHPNLERAGAQPHPALAKRSSKPAGLATQAAR